MLIKRANRDNTYIKNIADNIFNKMGIPLNFASKLVDDLIFILIENIIENKKFKIKNFGTFDLKTKKKRIGRNPKNKVNHEISERNVVKFRTAEALKRKMNINDKK